MLLRTVRATIEKYNMLERGDRVVIAVSGGPDSVALLHVLNSLKGSYQIELHVAHLEHGLRGDESIEDMQFVEDLCEKLAIPISTRREDISVAASCAKLPLEAVARRVRYAFLEDVLAETGANKIATGHNANDQAETVLLNLLRGSGMAGLRGIRPAIVGRIIRPLIESKREEILSYLKENELSYRTDTSNLDDRFERNKIRSVLIPLMEREFNPKIVDSLVKTASVFALAAEYLEQKVDDAIKVCCTSEHGMTLIDLQSFGKLHDLIKLLTLYSVLRSLEIDEQVVSYDTLSAVLNLALRSTSGSRIDIGSGIEALREFDKLTIGRDLSHRTGYEVELAIPGSTHIEKAEGSFEVEILGESPGDVAVQRNKETVYFDFAKLAAPLVARNWREGDRFTPFGLTGSKKVHDVFIDDRVPVSQRRKIPIICDGQGIVWVTGIRRADRARITDDTNTIVKITFKKDG